MTELEKLFDENNTDPITLYNEAGEAVSFEQIAIIPQNEQVYVILRPVLPMEGLGEDEALVFVVTEVGDEEGLVLVDDDDIIDAVFEVYERLLEESEQ